MTVSDFAAAAATRAERRAALVIVALLSAVFIAALLVHPTLPEAHGFLAAITGSIIITELLSAYVFYSQFAESRSTSLLFIAIAYACSGTLAIPYLLTFPEIFVRGELFDAGPQTALILWSLWHAAFPFFIMVHVLAYRYAPRRSRSVGAAIAISLAAIVSCATAATVAAIALRAYLPRLINGTAFTPLTVYGVLPVLCALDLFALLLLWRLTRLRSQTHLWLSVSVYASLLDAILGVTSPRYAPGWYIGKGLALVSSAVMLAVFVRATARLYREARNAYDELARVRERERRQSAERLRHAEVLLAGTQAAGRLGTWEYDVRSRTMTWSQGLRELLCVSDAVQPSFDAYLQCVHPDDRGRILSAIHDRRAVPQRYEYVHRILLPDGSVRWIEDKVDFLADGNGEVVRWFGIVADITERKSAEERIAHLAFGDEVTGLPNRAAFRARLAEMLGDHERSEAAVAVLFLDVDHFKYINDTLGHDVGDAFLRALADRLRGATGGALLARFGGDEFAIALPGVRDAEDARRYAQCILDAASLPVRIAGREFPSSASIGVSLYPQDGATTEELLRNADIAMYKVKESGRHGICFFSPTMREEQRERLMLEGDIRAALQRSAFRLHYQPLVAAHSGTVAGVEALLRWSHPQRGDVSPASVVEIAERVGLIRDLGAWVLREGLAQRARWQGVHDEITIALNVSAGQLQDPHFSANLERLLAEAGVRAAEIELEITESVAMEGAIVAEQISRCRDLGVRFCLDDFGTHYSSLSYLQRLPVDTIKIDRSFVSNVPDDRNDAAIVRAVIRLAHDLGRTVVAEGVENDRQYRWLTEQGCDLIQGYHVAKPMSEERLTRWLSSRRMVVA